MRNRRKEAQHGFVGAHRMSEAQRGTPGSLEERRLYNNLHEKFGKTIAVALISNSVARRFLLALNEMIPTFFNHNDDDDDEHKTVS